MEILLTIMQALFSLLTWVNWLAVGASLFALVSMLVIIFWVFHPANRDSYESHASIPLEDVLDSEPDYYPEPESRFSIFL